MSRIAVSIAAALSSVTLFSPVAAQGRSFVGKTLSGVTFTDTEGHTIDPEHYRGSVLVMIAGIPW